MVTRIRSGGDTLVVFEPAEPDAAAMDVAIVLSIAPADGRPASINLSREQVAELRAALAAAPDA